MIDLLCLGLWDKRRGLFRVWDKDRGTAHICAVKHEARQVLRVVDQRLYTNKHLQDKATENQLELSAHGLAKEQESVAAFTHSARPF